jgi:hypothetical protein
MSWSIAKDVVVILGGLVALLTLVKGVREYSLNGTMKRAEYFAALYRQLHDIVVLGKICRLLDEESKELATVPYSEKFQFLAFFENVALMVNSGLLKRDLAQYMFAYYGIRCYESQAFWINMNRDSPYWMLFVSFAQAMKSDEAMLGKAPGRLASLKF